MARKKVKLAWIANDSARRATFKKRKKGLMKKVSELSTLCGVSACAIVYGSFDQQPEVWPSPLDTQRVLGRFKSLPEMEQSKKMMNQEGFLRQRITKLKEQLKRQQKENREYEMTQLMYQSMAGKDLRDLGIEDLSDLTWLIDEKMKMIRERVEVLRRTPPQFVTVDEKKRVGEGIEEDKSALEVAMEALQRQPWFMEVMNPHDHLGCGGDELVPYVDNSPWSNPFFP